MTMQDIQYDLLAKLRAVGVSGDATVFLSPLNARRLVDGLQQIHSAVSKPEDIDQYSGTKNYGGMVRYRFDTSLPHGVCVIEQPGRSPIRLNVSDVFR